MSDFYSEFNRYDWYLRPAELADAIERERNRCLKIETEEKIDGIAKLLNFVSDLTSSRDTKCFSYSKWDQWCSTLQSDIANLAPIFPDSPIAKEWFKDMERDFRYLRLTSFLPEDCMDSFFSSECDGVCKDCEWWQSRFIFHKNEFAIQDDEKIEWWEEGLPF